MTLSSAEQRPRPRDDARNMSSVRRRVWVLLTACNGRNRAGSDRCPSYARRHDEDVVLAALALARKYGIVSNPPERQNHCAACNAESSTLRKSFATLDLAAVTVCSAAADISRRW